MKNIKKINNLLLITKIVKFIREKVKLFAFTFFEVSAESSPPNVRREFYNYYQRVAPKSSIKSEDKQNSS